MGKSTRRAAPKDEAIKRLADRITRAVKARGVTVQRYDSITTNSVYLRFDYGVSCGLRISDHNGRRNISYRFNLLTTLERSYAELEGEHPRYYYCLADCDKLISAIVANRDFQMDKYGPRHYEYLMMRNRASNTDTKGFWSKAKIV